METPDINVSFAQVSIVVCLLPRTSTKTNRRNVEGLLQVGPASPPKRPRAYQHISHSRVSRKGALEVRTRGVETRVAAAATTAATADLCEYISMSIKGGNQALE